jgi:amidase
MFNIKCNYQISINKENEFIAKVKPQEKFCVETINAYGDKFKNLDELITLINCKDGKTHHHPLTGPIYIENAKPGDVIKVHIHKIETEEMAQSLSKTAGIAPIENANIADRIPIISSKFSKDEIKYSNGIKLKYMPMIGMIATTPKEEIIKTGHAKMRNGGNLDLPFITENTDIYLPVDIEGAGLYLGDVHSLQGYGELSGIAMEASSKIILDIEILKPKKIFNNILAIGTEPFSKNECLGIVGIGKKMDLTASVNDAFCGTINLVKQLIPTMSDNMVKSLITLIGNSFNGQAFSKTSESTSIIAIPKENIERIIQTTYIDLSEEIEKIIFK